MDVGLSSHRMSSTPVRVVSEWCVCSRLPVATFKSPKHELMQHPESHYVCPVSSIGQGHPYELIWHLVSYEGQCFMQHDACNTSLFMRGLSSLKLHETCVCVCVCVCCPSGFMLQRESSSVFRDIYKSKQKQRNLKSLINACFLLWFSKVL